MDTSINFNELKCIKALDKVFGVTKFSAYDFFRLFIAKIALHKVSFINQSQIVKTFYDFSTDDNFNGLLSGIGFSITGDDVSSQDVEDGITGLQTLGMIGKLNPTFERIVVYMDSKIASGIVNEYNLSRDDTERINRIVSKFVN